MKTDLINVLSEKSLHRRKTIRERKLVPEQLKKKPNQNKNTGTFKNRLNENYRLISYLAPWIFLWKHSNCGGGRVLNMQKQFKSIKGSVPSTGK